MKMDKYDCEILRRDVAELYSRNHIPMAAAGLSYFLTFSFFPMLICLYTMLGDAFPKKAEITGFLRGVLPDDAISAVLDYLMYVSDHLSDTMLVAALLAVVTSSASAFRLICREMGEMWGEQRFSGFISYVVSFGFSLIFLAAVYFAVLLTVTGKWFLEFADRHIMFMNISERWSWGRFVLLFFLLFALLSSLYRVTSPRGKHARFLTGAALASFTLVGICILFSAFVSASAKYSLIYGSLASIVIMMLWLYICGVILFLGNALIIAMDHQ